MGAAAPLRGGDRGRICGIAAGRLLEQSVLLLHHLAVGGPVLRAALHRGLVADSGRAAAPRRRGRGRDRFRGGRCGAVAPRGGGRGPLPVHPSGPWFDGIAAQGTTPDGDEWVLSQAWIDWNDAYGLRLFTRKPGGMWHSWWGGPFWKAHQSPDRYEVRLDGSRHWPEIHFARGGERIFQHNRQDMHPADLSPADLHAAHRAETGPNRSLLAAWEAGLSTDAAAPCR